MGKPRLVRAGRVGRYLPPIGSEFVSVETSSALALVLAASAALVWANVDGMSYADAWQHDVGPLTLGQWINDALMALFFFVVGLEIKRETVEGELDETRKAALPAIAAVGGMVVPALIFTAWNAGGAGANGWGVPMATDIAFALGVLALLGTRVRPEAKLFLLALAIVDDIGAIVVIAVFYSPSVDLAWLAAAGGVCVAIVALRRVGARHPAVFIVPGVVLWACVHESGVHATIAGVVFALLLPTSADDDGVAERIEHRLHPWTALVVVPVFALANAGVTLDGDSLVRAFDSPVTLGILTGLVVGKMLGIVVFSWVGLRLGVARLPSGLDGTQIAAVAIVAGIGFTVSLFIAELAFSGPTLTDAKIGILAASVVAGVCGLVAVAISSRHRARSSA